MPSKDVGGMSLGIRPGLGLGPTHPRQTARIRTEPPMSVPLASAGQPVAAPTAEPPGESPPVPRRAPSPPHEGERVEAGLHRVDPAQGRPCGLPRREMPCGDLPGGPRGRERAGIGRVRGRAPPHCFRRVQIWS